MYLPYTSLTAESLNKFHSDSYKNSLRKSLLLETGQHNRDVAFQARG